jgi:hypothetical protein
MKPKPALPPVDCRGVTLDNPSRAMALVSVQFNSDPPRVAMAPIQIMPIDQAVLVIRCDEGDAAELRRRRTVAKLATAPDPLVQRRVGQLVGRGDEDDIKSILAGLARAPRLLKETAVYDYFFDKYGAVSGCATTVPVTNVTPGPDGTVHATTSFDVNRSVASLKVVWDPQRWQECSPLFFTHSYVVDANESLPSNCADSDPAPASAPPAPGSTWSGRLYEHFTFSWPGLSAFSSTSPWFKNFLDISTYALTVHIKGSDPSSLYGYHYALRPSLCSQVGLLAGPQAGGVEVDCGHSYLSTKPNGWTGTLTTKNVRFSARPAIWHFGVMIAPAISQEIMNGYADVLMHAMGDETSRMACCKAKLKRASGW